MQFIGDLLVGKYKGKQKTVGWTSLMLQWLRTCLLMQRKWVRSLVREDTTCLRQLSPCATTTEACDLEPVFLNKKSHHN